MVFIMLVIFSIVSLELFVFLQMSKDAMAIIGLSQRCMRTLLSFAGQDEEREALIRRGAADIFKVTCLFTMKLVFVVIVVCLPFLVTVWLFPEVGDVMLESLASLTTLAIVVAVIVCYALVRKRIVTKL